VTATTFPPIAAGTDSRARRRRPRSLQFGAELALTLVTLTAIAGFARLYRDGSFFPPLAAVAVAAHGLASWCRRRALPPALVAVVAVAGGAILFGWLFFPHATTFGLPTTHTWSVANTAVDEAWGRFGRIVAPAPVLPGFQLSAAVAIWGAAWFADWSAFRLWAGVESVVPAGVLFVFGAMLGAPPHRIWTTTVFGVGLLVFMLVHRLARQEGIGNWVAATPGTGRRSLLQLGTVLAACAVLGGVVVGPHLPGAGDKGLLSWRQSRPNGSRITVSPLVDIRKRLVNQSDQVAFEVRANHRSYWRLTSLDTFDGRIWSSGGTFAEANGRLPQPTPGSADSQRITQEFRITALSAIWAPAAFEPTAVRRDEAKLRWDADSATLIVDEDRSTSDDVSYEVESRVPRFTRDNLLAARELLPDGVQRRYLGLPTDFRRSKATALARSIVAGAPTPYDKALALQNYFRAFVYDLNVPAGHSENAIAEFLASRRGYCEQFAGTYAAMARAVGLPARVAVGFTPGDVDPSDPQLYLVKGRHAHAWPEVYLSDAGWVPFEPTPGRGAPGAEQYTGVPEQQDSVTASPRTTSTTVAPATPQPSAPRNFGRFEQPSSRVAAGGDQAARKHPSGVAHRPAVLALLVVVALGLLYVAGALLGPLLRRHRRRRRAAQGGGADLVGVNWEEATDAVALLATAAPRSSETHGEFAARMATPLGPLGGSYRELAGLATAASWSATSPPPDAVGRAQDLSRGVRRGVDQQLGLRRRLTRRLHPRIALPALTGRRAAPSPNARTPARWRVRRA